MNTTRKDTSTPADIATRSGGYVGVRHEGKSADGMTAYRVMVGEREAGEFLLGRKGCFPVLSVTKGGLGSRKSLGEAVEAIVAAWPAPRGPFGMREPRDEEQANALRRMPAVRRYGVIAEAARLFLAGEARPADAWERAIEAGAGR